MLRGFSKWSFWQHRWWFPYFWQAEGYQSVLYFQCSFYSSLFPSFPTFLAKPIRDVPTGSARCSFDCVGGASEATRPKRASQARPADLAVAVL